MIKNILLDLDGVIVDFMGGFMRHYGIDPGSVKQIPGNYEMTPSQFGLKMSNREMWAGLDYNFWSNLKFTPEAPTVIELLKNYNVTLLTSSPDTNVSKTIAGKMVWIKKNLPYYWQNKKYLIGPDKNACAHNGALLIDDSDMKVIRFRRAGGHAILFPRIWNSQHQVRDPLVYLEVALECYEGTLLDEYKRPCPEAVSTGRA